MEHTWQANQCNVYKYMYVGCYAKKIGLTFYITIHFNSSPDGYFCIKFHHHNHHDNNIIHNLHIVMYILDTQIFRPTNITNIISKYIYRIRSVSTQYCDT